MSWSERAQLYRDSEAHREGEDLDLVVEWSEGAETALDVATGGGHVARRLREAGVNVVTVDSAPGMQPDVVSRGEDLPFADASFDVVVCRVAAHHFDDVPKAVSEMARVSRDRVIVVDNLFLDDDAEEADRVRDPSHVRNWSEGEWRGFFAVRRPAGRRGAAPREADRGRALARAGGHERGGRAACPRAARRPDRGRLDHARPPRDQRPQVSAPPGDTRRLLARDHAAPEPTLVVAKASQPWLLRVRARAWCSRPRSGAASPEGALMADHRRQRHASSSSRG